MLSIFPSSTIASNHISSETARPRTLVFGMVYCLVDLKQVYLDGGPGVQNDLAAGVLGSKMNILKIFHLQNCLAQVLGIWYVALPGGPLPIFFKQSSKMAPRQGFLGSNHRNANKYIKKSSSSEPQGLDT